jgi:hypothetical protein
MSEAIGTTLVTRHRRFGWASLAVFALAGLLLETAHGFKWPPLIDHETRRTMWRLAHAHGALLGLVHVALAAQLSRTPESIGSRPRSVSLSLCAATILLPGGFVLGGAWFYEGDPGVGIALVPLGAVALIWACIQLARAGSDS